MTSLQVDPKLPQRPEAIPGTQSSSNTSLTDGFHEYFKVEFASSRKLKEAAFGIRYRVYCEEFAYEDKANFPDKKESDEYDDNALHCVITHKASGMPAACVRMIPAKFGSRESRLPFEKFIGHGIDRELIDSLGTDRDKVCEISRLAVDGAFRRRSGEQASRFGEIDSLELSQREKRTFGLITIATFLAVLAMGEISGKTEGFAMMEPFLARLLKKFGFNFQEVGPEIDYHGVRALYFCRYQDGLNGMVTELQDFYQAIYKSVKNSYNKDSIAEWKTTSLR